jgi:hypothetical protein
MRANEFLTERASPVIFHYTNIHAAMKILQQGQFELSSTYGSVEQQYAPQGYPFFLSCTRTLTGGYHNIVGDSACMFNLDGNYYNQHYKAAPVNYWGERHNTYGRVSEAEDRIFSKEPTMPISGVTTVHVYVKPMDPAQRKNWGTYLPSYARKILIAAKTHGIKTYLYEDETAWRRQDIRKVVTPQKGRETITGPERAVGYTRGTSYMEPWIELLHCTSTNQLSKKAQSLAFSIAYDGEYYLDATIKGLENDFSNARKPNAGPDRNVALKMIQFMQQNKLANVKEFIVALTNKWKGIKEKEHASK